MSVNKEELKKQLIEELNLEELTVADIADDSLLFGDNGIGLDSIDALELIVLLENYYGIKLTNPEEGKDVFESISSMANYIEKNS
jgi:acyl carrier protein